MTGPYDDIELASTTADREVELVAVIGRPCHHVPADTAWSHVAGLMIGQDISDRVLRSAAGGQFSLGTSRPGYAPATSCRGFPR